MRLRGLILTNLGASVAFTVMYSTQPVLPQIGHDFHVGPAEAGLTLLAVTFALAFASLGAGRLTARLGARRIMLACSALLALLSFAVAAAPTFWLLVGLRAAQGMLIPGITVAGLAYLHNDLPAAWRGRISGFYIATNTLGGLLGRLGVGLTVEAITWRGGLALVALAAVAGSAALYWGLPHQARSPGTHAPSQRSTAAADDDARVATAGASLGQVARRLWWAPLIGGTVFFPFLTLFTYTPYRLETAPFHLSAGATSLVYLVYVLGAIASPLAGQLSDRIGRRPAIFGALAFSAAGLGLSMVNALPIVVVSLGVVCAGGLMAHVVANASVSDGANPLAASARATALSLYTCGFYIGGGLGAYLPGYGWAHWGWLGVVVPCVVAIAGAGLCALRTPTRPASPAALVLVPEGT